MFSEILRQEHWHVKLVVQGASLQRSVALRAEWAMALLALTEISLQGSNCSKDVATWTLQCSGKDSASPGYLEEFPSDVLMLSKASALFFPAGGILLA